jgi:hypothetical protein
MLSMTPETPPVVSMRFLGSWWAPPWEPGLVWRSADGAIRETLRIEPPPRFNPFASGYEPPSDPVTLRRVIVAWGATEAIVYLEPRDVRAMRGLQVLSLAMQLLQVLAHVANDGVWPERVQ